MEYESAWLRAWADTKAAHHTISFFWLVDVGCLATGGVVGAIITPNGVSKLVTALYPALGSVIGAVVAVSLIFAMFFVVAPYRQRNEARSMLGTAKRPEQGTLDKINDFIKKGNSLFHANLREHPDRSLAVKDWLTNYERWFDDGLQFLEANLSPVEVDAFMDATKIDWEMSAPQAVNGSHAKKLKELRNEINSLVAIARRQEDAINS